MDDDDASVANVESATACDSSSSPCDVAYISVDTFPADVQDLETADVPIVLGNHPPADNMNYMDDGGSTPTASRSAVYVLDTAHAISVAAGFTSTGGFEITNTSQGHRRLNSDYGPDVEQLANDEDNNNLVLAAYESGCAMGNSFTAPARRVYSTLNDIHLDDDYLGRSSSILEASLDWAQDTPGACPVRIGLIMGSTPPTTYTLDALLFLNKYGTVTAIDDSDITASTDCDAYDVCVILWGSVATEYTELATSGTPIILMDDGAGQLEITSTDTESTYTDDEIEISDATTASAITLSGAVTDLIDLTSDATTAPFNTYDTGTIAEGCTYLYEEPADDTEAQTIICPKGAVNDASTAFPANRIFFGGRYAWWSDTTNNSNWDNIWTALIDWSTTDHGCASACEVLVVGVDATCTSGDCLYLLTGIESGLHTATYLQDTSYTSTSYSGGCTASADCDVIVIKYDATEAEVTGTGEAGIAVPVILMRRQLTGDYDFDSEGGGGNFGTDVNVLTTSHPITDHFSGTGDVTIFTGNDTTGVTSSGNAFGPDVVNLIQEDTGSGTDILLNLYDEGDEMEGSVTAPARRAFLGMPDASTGEKQTGTLIDEMLDGLVTWAAGGSASPLVATADTTIFNTVSARTNVTLTTPGNTNNGDILLAFVCKNQGTTGDDWSTAEADFTIRGAVSEDGGGDGAHAAFFTHVSDGTDDADYQFDNSNNANTGGLFYRIRGGTDWDVVGADYSSSGKSSSHVIPAVDNTVANSLAIACICQGDATGDPHSTVTSGWTLLDSVAIGTETYQTSMACFQSNIAKAGGGSAITVSSSVSDYASGLQISFSP